jgi:hypothetical protein
MKVYNYRLIKKYKIPAKQVTTLSKDELQELVNSMREKRITELKKHIKNIWIWKVGNVGVGGYPIDQNKRLPK